MNQRYLEITFRNGQPIAAYLYLPRKDGDRSARTERRSAGLVVDYAPDGRAIGIEITSARGFSIQALNDVLSSLKLEPIAKSEIAPLVAA